MTSRFGRRDTGKSRQSTTKSRPAGEMTIQVGWNNGGQRNEPN